MISIVVISKDEPALRETLAELSQQAGGDDAELFVVDASSGRLDDVRRLFPTVVWIDYEPGGAPGAGVTIPHQRNVGLRAGAGDVVVFTDAGCELAPGWLRSLTAPILDGSEEVTAGPARGSGPWGRLYDRDGATPSPTSTRRRRSTWRSTAAWSSASATSTRPSSTARTSTTPGGSSPPAPASGPCPRRS